MTAADARLIASLPVVSGVWAEFGTVRVESENLSWDSRAAAARDAAAALAAVREFDRLAGPTPMQALFLEAVQDAHVDDEGDDDA